MMKLKFQRKLSKNEVNLRSSIPISLKFRYKITIKSLFSKEKSTYSIFLAIILPTYSVFNTINIPTYSIFNTINESTYSVLSFISWRNLNIFARLRQLTNYFEASAMSAARSSSLIFFNNSRSSPFLSVAFISLLSPSLISLSK